ncbi:hypothetical protein [Muricoccus aerilatus]|uniref:hypothetical protein n=1 Tax=Muricoccus aerilatus TaxID=452982 RepID=UPI0005C189E0|nr:hypothetical protein [Roseomonas aerilata]
MSNQVRGIAWKLPQQPEPPAGLAALYPFHSPSEVEEARGMLARGSTGREIAEWFGMDLGLVAEWVVREREAAR